jgi:PilZ domain
MNETTRPLDRRQCLRRLPKAHVKTYLRVGDKVLGERFGLSLRDLSETGAGMIAREAVQPGREAMVAIDGQATSHGILSVANVVWCEPAEGGAFMLGLSFQKPLPNLNIVAVTEESHSYYTGPVSRLRAKPDDR